MADDKETFYYVKIENRGRAARVIHDGARPVQVHAGQTIDDVLSDAAIKRLKAEPEIEGEPKLEIHQGPKADEPPAGAGQGAMPHTSAAEHGSQHVASGEDNASHKRRPPPA